MKKGNGRHHFEVPPVFLCPIFLYMYSTVPDVPVWEEHDVCLPLLLGESLAYQPCAEQVGVVGVQPESDGDDDFKRVHIGVQTVFKLHIVAHLVVVQHVRLADGFDGGIHCRNSRMEQSGDFGGGHPYVVTGYADRLFIYDDYVTFHGFSF